METNAEEKLFGIEHYMPNQWKLKPFKQQKLNILQETSFKMQQTIKNAPFQIIFRGQQIEFFPIKECCETADIILNKNLPPTICGGFNSKNNLIEINPAILPDGKLSCETATHETVHKMQQDMRKSINNYEQNSLQWQYLKLLEYSDANAINNFSAFGIEFTGTMYMSGNKINRVSIDDRSSAFYTLATLERHAYFTAERLIAKLPDNENLSRLALVRPSYAKTQIT